MWGWIARCARREIPDDEVATRLGAALACVRTIEERLAGSELGSIAAATAALGRLQMVVGAFTPEDVAAARDAALELGAELEEMRRALALARSAKRVTTDTDAAEQAADASIRRAPRPPW